MSVQRFSQMIYIYIYENDYYIAFLVQRVFTDKICYDGCVNNNKNFFEIYISLFEKQSRVYHRKFCGFANLC